jgi:hypothetical protein
LARKGGSKYKEGVMQHKYEERAAQYEDEEEQSTEWRVLPSLRKDRPGKT